MLKSLSIQQPQVVGKEVIEKIYRMEALSKENKDQCLVVAKLYELVS